LDYLTNIREVLVEPSVVPSSKMTTVAEMVIKDGLTGLYDHSTLQSRLTAEIRRATRYRQHLSFVMLDIDRFKRYNDAHGHRAGDRVLATVAAVIDDEIREIDTGARYGGEEFAVIAPSTGAAEAHTLAERVRCGVEQALRSESITISAGVAELGGLIVTAAELIGAADAALYESKLGGRNRTTIWRD
jgi:diguanylate cyclase (GGDEF)-like protein